MIDRKSGVFKEKKDIKLYWIFLAIFISLSLLAAYGLLVYRNPVAIDSPSFIPIVKRRINAVIAMAIATVCQSLATVAFQSVTNNRVITPSLLGFEALYSTIQTSIIFFFGASSLIAFQGTSAFLIQIALMIIMSLILYSWLFKGDSKSLQLMLLIGIILGTGLRSISSFMRKVLSPSEFDILQARLFGSVNNADSEYFPLAIILVLISVLALFSQTKKLNVVSLGKDVATNLGVSYKNTVIFTLIFVAILMSISTALIGPMTFFGFLVATLTYQLVKTYDHKYIFAMTISLGFLILTSSYFLMYHVFSAQGVVSIIIEMVGGLVFLALIFRKDKQ